LFVCATKHKISRPYNFTEARRFQHVLCARFDFGMRVPVKNPPFLVLHFQAANVRPELWVLYKVYLVVRIWIKEHPPAHAVHGQVLVRRRAPAPHTHLDHQLAAKGVR
jgi:hypothetical protein